MLSGVTHQFETALLLLLIVSPTSPFHDPDGWLRLWIQFPAADDVVDEER